MELVVSIFSAIASFTLALFVLLKNKKSATNVYFGVLIFFLGLYPVFNHLALTAGSDSEVFLWAKMILLVSIPAGPLFYFFVSSFPSNKFIFNKLIQSVMVIWILTNMALALMGMVFESVFIDAGSLQIIPGPAVASFALLQLFSITAGSITLIRKFKKARGRLRLQLQYITAGILFSFGITLIATVLLPIALNNTTLLPLSPLFLLLGELAIAYSIVKHQLLDIKPALARTVSFSVVSVVFAVMYTGIIFMLSNSVLPEEISLNTIGLLSILNVGAIFTFQPVSRFLQKATNRVFFKDKYDEAALLHEITNIMASTLLLEDMAHQIIHVLLRDMKIKQGAFILIENNKIYQVSGNFDDLPEIDESEMVALVKHQDALVTDYVEDEVLREILEKYGFNFSLRLATDESVIGLLVLGDKLSGESYNQIDQSVLSILGPQAAIAFENAKSYEEIRRFNITLEEEVDEATKELKNVNSKLQELDELKDEFVSMASHELRTPLTSIKNYIWMALAGKGGKLTEKQEYYMSRSFSATERLIKLVNNLLNISRIESGRIGLQVEKVSVNELVEGSLDEVRPRADELGIKIEFDATEDLKNQEVIADIDKIKEVLINLVGNSLKFTSKDGLIKVEVKEREKDVVISVVDNGVGISKDNIKGLFQKFGFIKGSYKTNQQASQGTGLGLFISKSIIELHEGKIWAESKGVGHGAAFRFSIPKYTEKKLKDFIKKHEDDSDIGIIGSKI